MDENDQPVVFKMRLYPGQDDDLIAWLRGIEGPRGAKSVSLKRVWRSGISEAGHVGSLSQGQKMSLLVDIRKVVEAAVSSSISQIAGGPLRSGQSQPEDPEDETEQILLALDEGMLLSAE